MNSPRDAPAGDVAELLVRNLGLLALPSAALASAIESLAAGLEVAPEQALALLTTQPTLLCTQARPSLFEARHGRCSVFCELSRYLELQIAIDEAAALPRLAAT